MLQHTMKTFPQPPSSPYSNLNAVNDTKQDAPNENARDSDGPGSDAVNACPQEKDFPT